MKWSLLFPTRRLSLCWTTCHSRRLCHDLHSNATHRSHATAKHVRSFLMSTSLGESRIHTTFRPFRSVTNDAVLIIRGFAHQRCNKQVVISCLISGCTFGIFELDNVQFSLGCHLVFALTASVRRCVTQPISCWANVTFERLCARVWLAQEWSQERIGLIKNRIRYIRRNGREKNRRVWCWKIESKDEAAKILFGEHYVSEYLGSTCSRNCLEEKRESGPLTFVWEEAIKWFWPSNDFIRWESGDEKATNHLSMMLDSVMFSGTVNTKIFPLFRSCAAGDRKKKHNIAPDLFSSQLCSKNCQNDYF